MQIDDVTFVVADTETTGLRPGPHRVIEIGAVRLEGGTITDTFSQLIDPGCAIPGHITRLTGITTPEVFGAPSASVVLPEFVDFLGDAVLVGHNIAFDRRFLQFELRKAGMPSQLGRTLCTMRLARRILHALPSKSLASLIQHYGLSVARRHRALDDAQATAEVFVRLVRALQNDSNITEIDALLRFQNKRIYHRRSIPANIRRIRDDHIRTLPEVPGVYLFKDRSGTLIYVGKARNVRSRVRSYFSGVDSHPVRIRLMIKAIHDVDFIPTPSELSALILESKLIKRYRPRYNRAEVRYRQLPFLRVARGPEPSVTWSYEIKPDEADYYGPLRGRDEADRLSRIAVQLALTKPGTSDGLQALLSGQFDDIIPILETNMHDAADRLDFERARQVRDDLAYLVDLEARPFGASVSLLDQNLVGIHHSEIHAECSVFVIRRGRLAGDTTIKLPAAADEIAAVRMLIVNAFEGCVVDATYRKNEIDEIRIIANWLHRSRANLVTLMFGPEKSVDELTDRVVDQMGRF